VRSPGLRRLPPQDLNAETLCEPRPWLVHHRLADIDLCENHDAR